MATKLLFQAFLNLLLSVVTFLHLNASQGAAEEDEVAEIKTHH